MRSVLLWTAPSDVGLCTLEHNHSPMHEAIALQDAQLLSDTGGEREYRKVGRNLGMRGIHKWR